jgi:hypothetical protein
MREEWSDSGESIIRDVNLQILSWGEECGSAVYQAALPSTLELGGAVKGRFMSPLPTTPIAFAWMKNPLFGKLVFVKDMAFAEPWTAR